MPSLTYLDIILVSLTLDHTILTGLSILHMKSGNETKMRRLWRLGAPLVWCSTALADLVLRS